MLGVHSALKQVHPDIITIIVPRHPQHGKQIALVWFMFSPISIYLLSFSYCPNFSILKAKTKSLSLLNHDHTQVLLQTVKWTFE